MFDSFKKAILAKRIKKATMPAANIAGSGIIVYERLLNSILNSMSSIIQQSVPIIEDNADKIAEAVLILEPVFKELAAMKAIEKFKNLAESDGLEDMEDPVMKQSIDDIKEYAAEFEEATKAV